MTDQLELFASALCPYAQRVRILLAEKGLQATEIEVDPRNRPGNLTALSPEGKIPLLVHDGRGVWESSIINEYLDEAFPIGRLMPENPQDRALVRGLICFADQYIYEPSHELLLALDPDRQRTIGDGIAQRLTWFEAQSLDRHGGPYLAGPDFGLADVALMPWFEQLAVLEAFRGFRMPVSCRLLPRWFDRVRTRAAVASVLRTPEYYLAGYGALARQLAEGKLPATSAV